MHPPQRGERKFGLGTPLAGDELDDPQQAAGTQQAGQEAPDPATVTKVEQGQDPATQEATDDTNDDVSWDAHLSIGAHDLGADPASQATDDDPADEAEGRGSACSEQPRNAVFIPSFLQAVQRSCKGYMNSCIADYRIIAGHPYHRRKKSHASSLRLRTTSPAGTCARSNPTPCPACSFNSSA